MFESENWKLSFYIPKPNALKKRSVMHTALPHEAASYLKDLPKFTHESFTEALKSQYVLVFAPFSEGKTSKLRFAMKFQYKCPMQNVTISFSDALIYFMLELQNEVYAMLSEEGRILYNPSSIEESMKQTFKLLMRGAGIFDWILSHLSAIDSKGVSPQMPFELSAEFNTIMRDVLLAQAQEIGVYYSMDKDKKYKIMAKLAQKSFLLYRDAYEMLERSDTFANKADKTDQYFALRGYLAMKMILFDAYAHLQSALHYNDENNNGEAMYLIRDAQSRTKKAQKVSKKFTSRYWDKESIKNCKTQIEYIADLTARMAQRFENENATVYHAKLPDEAPDLLEAQQLGKMEPFEFLKPDNLEGFQDFYNDMHTGVEEMSLDERATSAVAGNNNDSDVDSSSNEPRTKAASKKAKKENSDDDSDGGDVPECTTKKNSDSKKSSADGKKCTIL